MTMLFTHNRTDRRRARSVRWPLALAAVALIAGAAPTFACEKGAPTLVASASAATPTSAVFSGEFVNGAPVYRLPSITVVGRRSSVVAKTQRDDAPVRSRSRANAAAAPSQPGRNVANAAREGSEIKPCVG